MANHEYYAELCAGAAADVANSGHLTEVEWDELIQHLRECADCQELLRNFMQVSFHLVGEKTSSATSVAEPGTKPNQRHMQRAQLPHDRRPEGRLLPHQVVEPSRGRPGRGFWVAAMITSLATCFVLGAMFGLRRNATGVSQIHAPKTSTAANSEDSHSSVRDLNSENSRLTTELRSAEQEEASLTRRLEGSKAALAAAQGREKELTSRIAELEKATSGFAGKESDLNSQLAQLRIDVQALRAEREANRRAVQGTQAELLERGAEVKRIAAQLEDERKRNATLSEAQDFLESPDSRVLPIYDHDENGKVLFGRILYTEGKKLVFYAYNLPDGRVHGAEVSFYVWGEKPGTHQPIRSLGILRADSTTARRWKLEFEDPNVLAKIDNVFVTAEPGRTAVEPQGKRMLSASLDPKAVH